MLRRCRNERNIAENILRFFIPCLIYAAISVVVSAAGYLLLPVIAAHMGIQNGSTAYQKLAVEAVLPLTAVAAAAGIPVFMRMIRNDRIQREKTGTFEAASGRILLRNRDILLLVLAAVTACFFLNTLIHLSGIEQIFSGYKSTSEALYADGILAELLLAGLLVPLAEELVFRGLIYARLREWLGTVSSVLLSAAVFGIYHGNVVQFLYAFLAGTMIAWMMERYRTVKAPVTAHIALNITSVAASEMQAFTYIYASALRSAAALAITGILLASLLFLIKKPHKHEGI